MTLELATRVGDYPAAEEPVRRSRVTGRRSGPVAFLLDTAVGLAMTTVLASTGEVALGWVMLLWPVLVAASNPAPLGSPAPAPYRPILRAGMGMVLAAAITAALVGAEHELTLLLLCATGAVSASVTARWLLRGMRGGAALERAVLVGDAPGVGALIEQCRRGYTGLAPVATCLVGSAPEEDPSPRLIPRIDSLAEVPTAAEYVDADLVVALPNAELGPTLMRRLAWTLEGSPARLCVLTPLADVDLRRVRTVHTNGRLLLEVAPAGRDGAGAFLKLAFDRTVAAVLLVLTAPLLAALALLVKLDSPGPAVFSQTRVGLGGRPFTMYKFRTMRIDAEKVKISLLSRNDSSGLLFKIRRDPRCTRLGNWLRRFSIDELPQLYNVLCGHMSLIGPRPALPEEVARYDEWVKRRLAVRPGMTGLWQVSGRSNLSWEDSVRLDLSYIDNWRPAMDFGILIRTVRAVLFRSGAY